MIFGIICAGDSELDPFLPHLKDQVITEKALLKFYHGSIYDLPVIALFSGVCKVNAAIAAQILIDIYRVDAVINAGTAGGMSEDIKLFDTVIPTHVAYHDIADEILTEFHPWMQDSYFQADRDLLAKAHEIAAGNDAIHFGCMVTGERFIQDEMRESINRKFAPLSVDMETASIAHVCYVNKIPFIAIRSITDTAAHLGVENFEKNCQQASDIAKDVVLDLLKSICANSR